MTRVKVKGEKREEDKGKEVRAVARTRLADDDMANLIPTIPIQ